MKTKKPQLRNGGVHKDSDHGGHLLLQDQVHQEAGVPCNVLDCFSLTF